MRKQPSLSRIRNSPDYSTIEELEPVPVEDDFFQTITPAAFFREAESGAYRSHSTLWAVVELGAIAVAFLVMMILTRPG